MYAYANVVTQAAVPADHSGETSGVVLAMLVTMAGVGVGVAGTAIDTATAGGTSTGSAIRAVLASAALLPLVAATYLLVLRRADVPSSPAPPGDDVAQESLGLNR